MVKRVTHISFSIFFCGVIWLFSSELNAGMFGLGDRFLGSDMKQWIQQIWPHAQKRGISKKLYDQVTKGLRPDPEIFKIVDNQAEFIKPVGKYISKAVSDERVRVGREKLQTEAPLLKSLENKYNVSREILLAVWGLESAYGAVKGDKSVLRSTATLGYKGQRQNFGKSQFLAGLEILQNGEISPEKLKGSWAGAMGHTQFIPSTYLEHAVDYDGDGKRNIWESHSDALASTANYIANSGWKKNGSCFHEVSLPKNFDYLAAGRNKKKTVREWLNRGVKRRDGGRFGQMSEKAAVILPSGATGPAFIIFDNFYSILAYNQATSYVLAVCNLAGKLKGERKITGTWPEDIIPLNTIQKRELQQMLSDRGLYNYPVDGLLGPVTRDALQKWQKQNGFLPDGYPHQKLLQVIRKSN